LKLILDGETPAAVSAGSKQRELKLERFLSHKANKKVETP